MPIIFGTVNLNEQLYSRFIRRVIWEWFEYDLKKTMDFINEVDIEIYDKAEANSDYFSHVLSTSGGVLNTNIPSGVAGLKNIKLFLHDIKRNLWLHLENFDRVDHEIKHELVLHHDNWLVVNNRHVTLVHENTLRRTPITFWMKGFWTFWQRPTVRLIWIRDLLGA